MGLGNGVLDTGDVSGSGVTFVRLLDQRPVDDQRLEERLRPNELVGWHNGADDVVEMWLVSPDGWRLRRCTSGVQLY